MPRAVGLMNPANASKGAARDSFKEGVIRIDANNYVVHKGSHADNFPATKWQWKVTRMLEGGHGALTDENDQPVTDELLFSFGGKSIGGVHPGNARSPEDEDPEDLGATVGAEGNTIYLVTEDWRPDEKSSLMMLTKSMAAQGVASEFLNRCWTPDWTGAVFDMRNQASTGSDGKAINYKVVAKVLVGPGGKKVASKNGQPDDVARKLVGILIGMAEELDGQQLTRKAFQARIKTTLEQAKVDAKLLVPMLSLARDDHWLANLPETVNLTIDPIANTIIFGELSQTA